MRWTARRKEEIIVGLEAGMITTAEAQKRHGLSDDELAAWRRDYATHGLPGLHVTTLQPAHKKKAGAV